MSDAFERYSIRQILKDDDLSDDEMESGTLGGSDDGGVDGLYFFVNRRLIQDETDLPEEALTAELVIVQAKLETGFGETTVTKLEAFAKDLLDHNRDVDAMIHLSADVREAIRNLRDHYTKILASPHTMKVSFHYATKSDQSPNPKVATRVSIFAEVRQRSAVECRCRLPVLGRSALGGGRSPNSKHYRNIGYFETVYGRRRLRRLPRQARQLSEAASRRARQS